MWPDLSDYFFLNLAWRLLMKTHKILSNLLLIASSFLSVQFAYAENASISSAVTTIESQAQRVQLSLSTFSTSPQEVIQSGTNVLSR